MLLGSRHCPVLLLQCDPRERGYCAAVISLYISFINLVNTACQSEDRVIAIDYARHDQLVDGGSPEKNIIPFGSFIVLGASSFVFLEGLCLVGLFAILALNFKAKRFFDVKCKLFILSLQESLYPIMEASLWQLSDALRGHGISLSFFFIAQHLQTIVV